MATKNGDVEYIRSKLTFYPDFPKPGVNFVDIFPLLRDPIALETLITHFVHHLTSQTIPNSKPSSSKKIDVVVGLDARGFLFGPLIALRLGAAFVPVRKRGKLPGKCVTAEYAKEYGVDTFEMQEGAIPHGANVIVVDDLIATGGSASAAGELVRKQGGSVLEYLFIIGFPFLKGTDKLDAPTYVMLDIDD